MSLGCFDFIGGFFFVGIVWIEFLLDFLDIDLRKLVVFFGY